MIEHMRENVNQQAIISPRQWGTLSLKYDVMPVATKAAP